MEKNKNLMRIKIYTTMHFFMSVLLIIVSTFMIVCSSVLFVQFLMKPNSPPTVFGIIPQIIMTDEMSSNQVGHVDRGDLVFIKKVPIENIKELSVIAYIDNGNVLISRVIDIQTNENILLSIQVDNIEIEEEIINVISENQVLGTITQKVAGVGGFLCFTQSAIGIIIFIVIPSLILITFLILNITNKRKL